MSGGAPSSTLVAYTRQTSCGTGSRETGDLRRSVQRCLDCSLVSGPKRRVQAGMKLPAVVVSEEPGTVDHSRSFQEVSV